MNHIPTYVREKKFEGLTNAKLEELGTKIPLAPGLPEFLQTSKNYISDCERFQKHDTSLEHYIVSAGLRQMILGSQVPDYVDEIWACELLPEAPRLGRGQDRPGTNHGDAILSQVGYTIDNTSKTRAIFEINKGANVTDVKVHDSVPEERRRSAVSEWETGQDTWL